MEPLEANLLEPRICPNPVFVFGAPRSGTHALAYSLAEHSQFWSQGESDILFHLFGDGRVEQTWQQAHDRRLPTWVRMYRVGKAELYGFLGLGLNALFTSRNPGKRWIDKSNVYTLMAGTLADMFPGALFLHLLRDGRRVVHSMMNYLNRFAERAEMIKAGAVPPFFTDFREACKTWRQYVEAGMNFWANHRSRCLTVVNEALVADPDRHFREIFRFLDVPFENAPVNYFRTHRIHSSFQRQTIELPPLDDLSKPWSDWPPEVVSFFCENKRYQDAGIPDQWTADQKAVFMEEAGATLVQCGLATEEELRRWYDSTAPA
jgi:hypothetical protein